MDPGQRSHPEKPGVVQLLLFQPPYSKAEGLKLGGSLCIFFISLDFYTALPARRLRNLSLTGSCANMLGYEGRMCPIEGATTQ